MFIFANIGDGSERRWEKREKKKKHIEVFELLIYTERKGNQTYIYIHKPTQPNKNLRFSIFFFLFWRTKDRVCKIPTQWSGDFPLLFPSKKNCSEKKEKRDLAMPAVIIKSGLAAVQILAAYSCGWM
jgi:hypothetical protein